MNALRMWFVRMIAVAVSKRAIKIDREMSDTDEREREVKESGEERERRKRGRR